MSRSPNTHDDKGEKVYLVPVPYNKLKRLGEGRMAGSYLREASTLRT